MNLWLVSNIRLDPAIGLKASGLQNLRTAAAIAAAGHDVLLWCDRIAPGGRGWAEEQLGVAFPENLRLRQAAARGGAGEKRSAFGALPDRAWNLMRGRLAGGRPEAILSRSPSVLRQLRASWLKPGATLLILELQYPEWSFLWRDWVRRHERAGLRERVTALRRMQAMERVGYAAADGILYAARSHERWLDRAGYAGPRRWIPSGCEAPEAGIAGGDEFDLGYVGTLAPENGLEALIEAMGRLEGRRLLLVGSGKRSYEEMLKAAAERWGVVDRVVFAGAKPAGEIRNWMRRCRVGVVPISARCGVEKRQFASPLKLVEWMAAGVAVAASAVPSIVQHREAGEPIALFPPDRPEAMANRLNELLRDERQRLAMAREGLGAAAKRSFAERARLVLSFIESVRSEARRHGR